MIFSKRAFLIAATGLTLGLAFDPMATLAQGGDNPVPGIDVIIKEAGRPFKPFSLGGGEIKQMNAIKGVGRMEYLLKTIAERIDAGEGFVRSGMKVMGKDWCGPCKWPDEINYEFTDVKTPYSLHLTFHNEGAPQVQSLTVPKVIKGSPKTQDLPTK